MITFQYFEECAYIYICIYITSIAQLMFRTYNTGGQN